MDIEREEARMMFHFISLNPNFHTYNEFIIIIIFAVQVAGIK